jgi:Xylose isomerase-like TIM barrel
MSDLTRRGFLSTVGGASIVGALDRDNLRPRASRWFALQGGAGSSASQGQTPPYRMTVGVHMTSWQNLMRQLNLSWEDIGRINGRDGLGFTGIQLQATGLDTASESDLGAIKRALNSQGLTINAVNIGNNFLAADFDAQVKMVERYAQICHSLEAPFERIYLGTKPANSNISDAKAFDTIRKGLETSLPVWEKYGVVAAPEPPDVYRRVGAGGRGGPGVSATPAAPAGPVPAATSGLPASTGQWTIAPKQFPSGDVAGILSLLKVIDSKYFRYMLDSGCVPPDEKYVWPQLLAPYTVGMHIKEWQYNFRTGAPTETDYVKFLEPFKRVGFHGSLDLEPRDFATGGFNLGSTVEEVSLVLKNLKKYIEACIAVPIV